MKTPIYNTIKYFHAGAKKQFPTIHLWRKHKRAEAKKARKAVHDLLIGCAFTPAHKEIAQTLNQMDDIMEMLSVKNWGK